MRTLPVILLALTAGCAGTRMSSDVMDVARSTKPAGLFHVEFGPDGRFVEAGAEVVIESVPTNCTAAADVAFPGGRVTGAERVRTPEGSVWMVAKEIDGRAIQVLVGDDGVVRGGEEMIAEVAWPAPVVAAGRAAVPQAVLKRVERVWGLEAEQGEAYHLKFDAGGDSIRVGVTAEAQVVRVVRRIDGQIRVPR